MSVVLKEVTRNKQTNEEKRRERQKELSEALNKKAQERLAQESGRSEAKKAVKSNVSYKSYDRFPQDAEVEGLVIHVDRRHDSVILPLFGIPVPFHISMIKNCSTSVENDTMYLRINFAHPGANIAAPSNNLNSAFRLIKDMQKKSRAEEAEQREKEGAVLQDKLIIAANKVNPKLKELYVRPNIISKRISGSLEAHTNGFRYTSLRGDKIEVLYNNIRHAFFQPCDKEMIILLHFHLKNPVLWGKKKHGDIQFFTEVGEITTDLGKYHHMQDRDDVASEQVEREMRRKLNQTFQAFCDKVVKQANEVFEFETPFNDLAFWGNPMRNSVMLKPTSSCLVNLTESPYTEGIQSLNWPKIMKTIVDDPVDFFQTGGWSFLDPAAEDEDDDEDDSDESEAYVPSGEDDESGSGSDSDSEESEGATEDDGGSDSSLDSDESEGKDWSDLEEEARRADKRGSADSRSDTDPRSIFGSARPSSGRASTRERKASSDEASFDTQ
ncbi:unnamed protein product, partial [Mesorhabditis belari]|uniref:FACT complex subunit n=1 Tax=Mesorhabditis belari TaxID=2138241 RepID=A0AAF3FDX9_9BILA